MKSFIKVLSLLLVISVSAGAQTITTYAGTGIAGYSGDGNQATDAQLYSPHGLAVDDSGNLYIAEQINNIIRKVTPTGIISTYAGNGHAGYSGDGGPATNAKLNFPYSVAVDHKGDLYFTDNGNDAIRKVTKEGIITTLEITVFARCAFGVIQELVTPRGIAIDDSGYIYFTNGNQMVLKILHNDTAITFAGNCNVTYTGDGGPASSAGMNQPMSVACDHAGNVYIGDDGNNVVRKVNKYGIISTYAGNGFTGSFYGDGGNATAAGIFGPIGVTTDNAGNLYIQDLFNRRIRKVNVAGKISTVAGNGVAAYSGDGGPATAASFYNCTGFAIDRHNDFYIADLNFSVVRKVTVDHTSVDEIKSAGGTLQLYPNPNNGDFTINYSPATQIDNDVTIEVLNVLGQVVFKGNFTPQQGSIVAQIEMKHNLVAGMYILSLSTGHERQSIRFQVSG